MTARLGFPVVIEAEERELHILDAGHRAADAIVRFSTPINSQLYQAFEALRDKGEAESLARIAPTSIVFGAWDSRGTPGKTASNRQVGNQGVQCQGTQAVGTVRQYATIAGEILEGGEAETGESGAKAELGLTHVPSVKTHGGIRADGGIRRDAVLNLSPLRVLGSESGDLEDDAKPKTLRSGFVSSRVHCSRLKLPCARDGEKIRRRESGMVKRNADCASWIRRWKAQ